jgi:outer membrane biosynthesis protein TonB
MLPTNPLLNATAPAGPHLPVALLRQYAAGTLAPAAQHRVEAHTLACPRCADILAGLLQTPAATTDQALAQLQQRLRQRTQPAAPARLLPTRPRRHRWLAPQLAVAAALLMGLVAGGWWVWQQRHSPPPSAAPMASTAPAPAPRVPAAPPASTPLPAAAPTTDSPTLAAVAPVPRRPRQFQRATATRSRRPVAAPAPVATSSPPPAASAATADIPAAPAAAPAIAGGALARVANAPDSAAPATKVSKAAGAEDAVRVRVGAMPAVPGLPPTPVGGYGAWREQLRREASEFKPESPERPLSGTVQLGVTIGPDGKIQELRVLRGLRADYDAEAQRLVCEGPKWVPGIMGGQRAARTVMVPVAFP